MGATSDAGGRASREVEGGGGRKRHDHRAQHDLGPGLLTHVSGEGLGLALPVGRVWRQCSFAGARHTSTKDLALV